MLHKTSKEFLCFDKFGKIPWRRAWQPTQYSCLENPMDRGACGLQFIESQSLGHDRGDLAHAACLCVIEGFVNFCFLGGLFKTS